MWLIPWSEQTQLEIERIFLLKLMTAALTSLKIETLHNLLAPSLVFDTISFTCLNLIA